MMISSMGIRIWVSPWASEHVERLGEDVVVDDAGVDWEHAHEKDDVATTKEHVENLKIL